MQNCTTGVIPIVQFLFLCLCGQKLQSAHPFRRNRSAVRELETSFFCIKKSKTPGVYRICAAVFFGIRLEIGDTYPRTFCGVFQKLLEMQI